VKLIYDVFGVLLILVNLFGLTVALLRWLPCAAIARAVGVIALVAGCFFIEHFVGLGALGGVWPISTALALLVLYRERGRWTRPDVWHAEAIFLAAFAYGVFWRASSPEITPTSERITNLYFIVNYLEGVRLPPADHWLPALPFDFYYALQHYGAALLARVFDLPPGYAYNLGFAVLAGLTIALAWDFASRLLQSRASKILIVLSLVIGGTGATPFIWLAYERPQGTGVNVEISDRIWGNARFIGDSDKRLMKDTGEPWFAAPPEVTPRSLPSENFGYQFALGDFHPPLGGFFLLLLAIALIGAIEVPQTRRHSRNSNINSNTTGDERLLTALLAATVPLQLATNTWVFPLQGLWVALWASWRWSAHRAPDWRALLAGGFGGVVLLFPFLRGFAQRSGEGAIEFVRSIDLTPLPQFFVLHWPVLLFVVLAVGVAIAGGRYRGLAATFAAAVALTLALSEIVFFNDPSGQHFERTNTVMKWWGFIQTGSVIALGTLLLAQAQRVLKAVVILSLLAMNLYAVDVFRHWNLIDKSNFAALRGDTAYVRDPVTREMFRYLERAPRGIVLENQFCDVYCDSGVYALFAAKPVLLNWPLHQQTWRQNVGSVWMLKDEISRFYAGDLARASDWLEFNGVRYVVWTRREAVNSAAWERIDTAIAQTHIWKEFGREGDVRFGFWVRRQDSGER